MSFWRPAPFHPTALNEIMKLKQQGNAEPALWQVHILVTSEVLFTQQ